MENWRSQLRALACVKVSAAGDGERRIRVAYFTEIFLAAQLNFPASLIGPEKLPAAAFDRATIDALLAP
jgi:hypothetical protein